MRCHPFFLGAINEVCLYRNFLTNTVAKDEGNAVGDVHRNVDIAQCKKHCDQTSECNSFAINPSSGGECSLKDKVLNGNEATKTIAGWSTYYRICG